MTLLISPHPESVTCHCPQRTPLGFIFILHTIVDIDIDPNRELYHKKRPYCSLMWTIKNILIIGINLSFSIKHSKICKQKLIDISG
jgi:hypothetical protein